MLRALTTVAWLMSTESIEMLPCIYTGTIASMEPSCFSDNSFLEYYFIYQVH